MLGVEFYEYDPTEFDKYGTAAVKLLFGNVDYSGLTKGTHFNITEGSRIVGKSSVSD